MPPSFTPRAPASLRWRRWSTRLAMLACLGLLQCSAPQPVPLHSGFEGVPSALRIEPEFRDGLDRLAAGRSWPLASGDDYDWVLLGVKVRCDGAERVWFVRVAEIIDPEEAEGGRRLRDRRFEYTLPFGVASMKPGAKFVIRCRRIRIETYDAAGEFIDETTRLSPDIFPEASLFNAFARMPEVGPMGAAMTRQAVDAEQSASQRDEGFYQMVAVLQSLGTAAPVAPIRDMVKDHIVQMPSILSVVFAGLKPSITAAMHGATPVQFPWVLDQVFVPCYQAEFTTQLAGERFFDCRVVAGPSVPPCDLIGGLLVIEAAHPRNPENRLTVRVLASSRARPEWQPAMPARSGEALVSR